MSETVTASANGNSVWMQNENGYAHIQGTQDNSGTVTADAYAQARYGAFRLSQRGHLTLVGLADRQRQPLGPPRARW